MDDLCKEARREDAKCTLRGKSGPVVLQEWDIDKFAEQSQARNLTPDCCTFLNACMYEGLHSGKLQGRGDLGGGEAEASVHHLKRLNGQVTFHTGNVLDKELGNIEGRGNGGSPISNVDDDRMTGWAVCGVEGASTPLHRLECPLIYM